MPKILSYAVLTLGVIHASACVTTDRELVVDSRAEPLIMGDGCDPTNFLRLNAAQLTAADDIRSAVIVYQTKQWRPERVAAFGLGHDQTRVNGVLVSMERVLNADDHGQPVFYDCLAECTNPDFVAEASVIPGWVRLCPKFWLYPDLAEALTHEYTHWFGTDDYVYGFDEARELARNDPGRAVNNADNYTLFVTSVR